MMNLKGQIFLGSLLALCLLVGCSNRKEAQLVEKANAHLDQYYSANFPKERLAALNLCMADWAEIEREELAPAKMIFSNRFFIQIRIAVATFESGDTKAAAIELGRARFFANKANLTANLNGIDLGDATSLPTIVERVHRLDADLSRR